MADERLALDDVYTRKVGGERYRYQLEYNTGTHVRWQAKVYQAGDDDLKGTPSGQIEDNRLEGDALRQQVITMVEVVIENMLGIAE
jgi:phage-related protein